GRGGPAAGARVGGAEGAAGRGRGGRCRAVAVGPGAAGRLAAGLVRGLRSAVRVVRLRHMCAPLAWPAGAGPVMCPRPGAYRELRSLEVPSADARAPISRVRDGRGIRHPEAGTEGAPYANVIDRVPDQQWARRGSNPRPAD